jgi:hypothetical protein
MARAPFHQFNREIAYNTSAARGFPFTLAENGIDIAFDADDTVTATVRDRNGATLSPNGVTVSLVAGTNKANLTFDTATHLARYPLAEGYVLTLTFTVDGVVYRREVLFDIVRYPYEPGFGREVYPPAWHPSENGPDDLSDYTMIGWGNALSFLGQLVATTQTLWGTARYGDPEYQSIVARLSPSILDVPVQYRIRPALILNRVMFDRVVIAAAKVAYVMENLTSGANGLEIALPEYRSELREAKAAFAATVQYDPGETGNAAAATPQSPVGGRWLRR